MHLPIVLFSYPPPVEFPLLFPFIIHFSLDKHCGRLVGALGRAPVVSS